MKVIVLGASGQIGSVIYNGLRPFHKVVGTSRERSNGYPQFDPFKDDWSTLGQPDVLINCVGQIQATNNSTFHHIHVGLTKQVLAHRAQLGNPRIIQISALGASSSHQVEFLKTKGMADDILLAYPDTAVIRPSIVCTHRTMLVRKMIMLLHLSRFFFGSLPIPKGFLTTRIQPIMPEDLVDLVHEACVDREVNQLDAVGPEEITLGEILQLLLKNRKQKLRIFQVPKTATDFFVRNVVGRLFPAVINEQQYQLLFEDNVANVDDCQKLLSRTPMSTRGFFEAEFANERETDRSNGEVKFLSIK